MPLLNWGRRRYIDHGREKEDRLRKLNFFSVSVYKGSFIENARSKVSLLCAATISGSQAYKVWGRQLSALYMSLGGVTDWSSTYSGSSPEVEDMGTAIPPPTSLTSGDIQEAAAVFEPVGGPGVADAADTPAPNAAPLVAEAPPPAADWGGADWGDVQHGRLMCQFCWTYVWGGPAALQTHHACSRLCRYHQNRMRRETDQYGELWPQDVNEEYSRSYGSGANWHQPHGNDASAPDVGVEPAAIPPAAATREENPRERLAKYLSDRKAEGGKKKKRRKEQKPAVDHAQRLERKRRRTPSPSPGGGGAPGLRCKRLDNQTLLLQMFQ